MTPERDQRLRELDRLLGHTPRRRRRTRREYVPQPCQTCGAADARDPQHAAGCPREIPLERGELVQFARQIEDGWRRER